MSVAIMPEGGGAGEREKLILGLGTEDTARLQGCALAQTLGWAPDPDWKFLSGALQAPRILGRPC
jgi:hypothetical protein